MSVERPPRAGRTSAPLAVLLVRATLRLFPRPFRRAFGEELALVFAARLREESSRGRRFAARLLARTLLDLCVAATLERIDALRGSAPAASSRETERMDRLLQDLAFAVRMLRKSPAVTAAATLTMALGIGANVALFSLVDALLLRPPAAVAEPDRVVSLFTVEDRHEGVSSYLDVRDLEHEMTSLDGLASFKPLAMDLSAADGTERIEGMLVTASFFETLGVQPAAGRFFLEEEDRPPAQQPVAVLGWDLWQRRFGGAPAVVGREVRLDGRAFTVVGIAPRYFRGTYLASRPELYAPMAMQPHFMPTSGYLLDRRGWGGVMAVGRLASGVSLEAANAELAVEGARLRAEHREAAEREYRLVPLRRGTLMPEVRDQAVRLGTLLFVVVALVMLVACANVSNLLLARSTARRRELAVRGALGAGRRRLMAQLFTESLLLALLGGAAGVGVAWCATRPLGSLSLPFALDPSVDLRVLAFAALATMSSALLCGLLPALRATGSPPAGELRGAGAPSGRPRLAGALVSTQIAIAILLAVLAGLLGRTLARLGATELGFAHRDVALATLDPALQGYDGAATAAFYDQLVERVRALPGVAAAGLTSALPGSEDRDVAGFFPPGAAFADRRMGMQFAVVDPGYFDTLGLPLRRGRTFSSHDGASAPPVVILNETAAALVERSLGRPALGARLWTGGADEPELEVVGIVADIKTGRVRDASAPMVHFAAAQAAAAGLVSRMTVLARSGSHAELLLSPIRSVVRELDADVPVVAAGTLDSHLAGALLRERLSAGVLGGSALLALLLAAVGLYGVLGNAVSRRTAELGVRMALGARAPDLVRMVVGQGLAMTAIGLCAGIVGAVFASRLLASLLYQVPRVDAVTYFGSALLLLAVGAVASFVPARQATRVDPVRALRRD